MPPIFLKSYALNTVKGDVTVTPGLIVYFKSRVACNFFLSFQDSDIASVVRECPSNSDLSILWDYTTGAE